MSQNHFQVAIYAKERTEQLLREAQNHQQVQEARAAKAGQQKSRKLFFLNARGWAANANR